MKIRYENKMEPKNINEMSDKGKPVFLYCIEPDTGKEYLIFGVRGEVEERRGIECLMVKISEENVVNGIAVQELPIPCPNIQLCLGDFYNFDKIVKAYLGKDNSDPDVYKGFRKQDKKE
jgi:hypothetical protein